MEEISKIANILELHQKQIDSLLRVIETLGKSIDTLHNRLEQLENYKSVMIGNGIWSVDTGGKMKDV